MRKRMVITAAILFALMSCGGQEQEERIIFSGSSTPESQPAEPESQRVETEVAPPVEAYPETSIAFVPNSEGTATLNWDIPLMNTDGSQLKDLAGYKIYHGTTSGVYTKIIFPGNVNFFTVQNLWPGMHYFAVTAYNTVGQESAYSEEASKTIQ